MLHVQATIDIQASPAEAFRLLCDPELKTRLNPDVELLRAASLTPGPLAVGNRVFYNLRVSGKACAFHCDITTLETNRCIEWLSDTTPAFRVRQTLEPTATGCRLVHEEWLATAAAAPARARKWSLTDVAHAFRQAAGLDLAAATALVADPGEAAQHAMQRSLERWLDNIRNHLEQPHPEPDADFHAISTVAF